MKQQNEIKHTPGPWQRISSTINRIDIVTCDKDDQPNGRVASIHRVAWCNEGEENANARLIAAAPQLLEALEDVLGHAEQMGCNCATSEQITRGHNSDCPANQKNSLFKKARAAIALATTK